MPTCWTLPAASPPWCMDVQCEEHVRRAVTGAAPGCARRASASGQLNRACVCVSACAGECPLRCCRGARRAGATRALSFARTCLYSLTVTCTCKVVSVYVSCACARSSARAAGRIGHRLSGVPLPGASERASRTRGCSISRMAGAALSDSDFSVIFQMSQRLLAVSPVPPRRPLCALRAALAVASSHTSHRSPALSHDAAASNEPSSSSICWMPFIWAPRATVFCNCARRCSSASSSVRTRASRSASAATCASCSA